MIRRVGGWRRWPWNVSKQERGAALIWLSMMLTFLVGAAAFAVDLGWLYVNSSRIQRTADAAALGGVTFMPSFPITAQSTAVDVASANGYVDGGNATLGYGAMSKFRLYRRQGMEVRWLEGGQELARKNLMLLVLRARFGGKVLDSNAFAKITDAQS